MAKRYVVGGLFDGWLWKYLPACVERADFGGRKKRASPYNLNSGQRAYVLKILGFASYAAYLSSPLWANIRKRAFAKRGRICICGCGRTATLIHHRCYSESNLTGATLKGLLPMTRECHHEIEFADGNWKRSLAGANTTLKAKRRAAGQFGPVLTEEEIDRCFTSAGLS